MLKRLFWDGERRRIAMLWRLLLQTLLVALLLVFTQLPFLIAGPIEITPLLGLVLTLASGVAIAAGVFLAGRFIDRRVIADFGLRFERDWWLDFAFGLGLGAVLMVLIFGVELAAGWVEVDGTLVAGDTVFAFGVAIGLQMLVFGAVGIYEELWFRGYYFKNLSEGIAALPFVGPRGAIVTSLLLTSGVFGLAHASNPNATLLSSVNIAIAGVMLGLGLLLTRRLAIPIGLHITWNFFQGSVFGFPVSGTDAGPTFIAIEQRGSVLLTGGTFGPEGGLVGLAAMGLGVALTILWVRMRAGNARIDERLAEAELRLVAPTPADMA